MKVGDLVKMKRGYSVPGLITHMANQLKAASSWVYITVEWPDAGHSLEKSSDLEVLSELTDEDLSQVRVGMSSNQYEHWRCGVINEGR